MDVKGQGDKGIRMHEVKSTENQKKIKKKSTTKYLKRGTWSDRQH